MKVELPLGACIIIPSDEAGGVLPDWLQEPLDELQEVRWLPDLQELIAVPIRTTELDADEHINHLYTNTFDYCSPWHRFTATDPNGVKWRVMQTTYS